MFRIYSGLVPKSIGSTTNAICQSSVPRHGRRCQISTGRVGKPKPVNPIALKLYKSTSGSKTKNGQAKGDKTRINIVSEALCDDVLERLATSLQKNANCDIIDINPGVSLWSSKLHEALKPRTHILMEPDKDLYLPYIQPLLDQKNSTYKLVPETGILWENLNNLETNKMLPNQTLLRSGDDRLEMPNDTLLMVANLGHYPSKSYMGFSSITVLMIHQLLTAIRAHSIFQGYGLIRMLIWMRDPEKNIVVPRAIPSRRKFSVEAEISCENIFEIAGSDEAVVSTRREHAVDLQSSYSVRDKMASKNVMTPPNRIGSLQAEVEEGSHEFSDMSTGAIRPFNSEYNELRERFARKEFCTYYTKDGKPVYHQGRRLPKGLNNEMCTPEWRKMVYLGYRTNKETLIASSTDRMLGEYEEIVESYKSLEKNYSSADREKELRDRFSNWSETLENLPEKFQSVISHRIDDRRSFHQDPPVLLWDRRVAEPLKVHEEEFFPPKDMCLLDMHPKSIWPILRGKNVSNYDYFEFMLASLFMFPTQSIARGLAALAPGAAEWIIPRCPSLTNIEKGGAIDVNDLSVRTLNQEMFQELIEAWMDWPFRPTKAEMMAKIGSQNVLEVDDEPADGRSSFQV